jgi:hypothetical protein
VSGVDGGFGNAQRMLKELQQNYEGMNERI